jgi:hypothetical protein
MVFSLSLDKTDFLYTDRADNTDGSVKRRKKSVRSVKLVLTVAALRHVSKYPCTKDRNFRF